MAEALGVAASVAGLVSLGIQLTQGILQYYGSWRDQDNDVAHMCASVDSLSNALAVLSETFQKHDPPSRSLQNRVVESVNRVSIDLKKLEGELERVQTTECPKPGARAALRRHVRRALYPFKEETLKKIQTTVSEARSDLNLTLQVLHIESTSDIRPDIKLLIRGKEDDETRRILRWLSPVNFWLKQEDVSKQREDGTGKWLLDDPDFLDWERGNKEMLWCCGSPGVGKTVLASTVIEFLEKDLPSSNIGFAFVYCNHKENLVQSVEYFLGAIVRQLVERRPTIPDQVRSLYAKHRGKETNPTCQEYMDLLLLLSQQCSEVYVAIDALDECVDKNGRIIWNGLLSKLKSSVSNLRLLYTSRDIEDIAGILTGSTRIEIRASERDIEVYVREQVKTVESLLQICEQDAELKDRIPLAIASKAEGIFLAARLYIEFLASKTNARAVKKALNALPSTLHENYEEAMKRIEQSPTKLLAFKVLVWIVFAIRPLKLKEVLHAVAVDELEPDDESVEDDCLTPPSTIVNACAGMIRIDKKSDVVGLVHKTTQEYFDENGTKLFPHAQRDITTGCLRYLSLPIFSSDYCLSNALFESQITKNVLLDYAVRSLGDHIPQGVDCNCKDLALLVFQDNRIMSNASQVLFAPSNNWDSDLNYSQVFPKQFQGVHLAAYFGLTDILKLLLEAKANVESKDSNGWTPLSWAAENGHEAVVKVLLEAKANVESKDRWGQTPLLLAVKNSHEAVVKLLAVVAKADVEADGRTPLLFAAENGHEAIVKVLLEAKANVESKDTWGQTPLSLAAENGYEAIVKLLVVEAKANVESKDRRGRAPLLWAAQNGHEAIVKVLLEAKADVESKDRLGQTPLLRAARNGHEAVVKLLVVVAKADIEAKVDGRTPLLFAAKNGHEAIVKVLLEAKANVESKDRWGQTPLSLAAGNGYEAVVKMLLEAKADVETKDNGGRTPLSHAAGFEDQDDFKILPRDERDLDSYIARKSHEAVIELLLAAKAQVDSKDRLDRTPLSYAAEKGHEAIVKLLRSFNSL